MGEGLVISYEDLVAKRAARAAFEQSKGLKKRKRGCKRKSPVETSVDESPTIVARVSGTQSEEAGSWRAAVAFSKRSIELS